MTARQHDSISANIITMRKHVRDSQHALIYTIASTLGLRATVPSKTWGSVQTRVPLESILLTGSEQQSG